MQTAQTVTPRPARGSLSPAWARAGRAAGVVLLATVAGAVGGLVLVTLVATRLLGFQLLTVASDSMAPAINAGDLVVVRPVAIDAVDEGDVVLFETGGDSVPVVHRVVGINEVELQLRDPATGRVESTTVRSLVTRGDANPAPDNGEVEAEDLRGEVWFRVPGAGAVAGRSMVLVTAAALGLSLAAWLAYEVALHLRDARRRPRRDADVL